LRKFITALDSNMKKILLLFIGLICLYFSVQSQDMIKETYNYKISGNGDATVIFSRTYTAAEWQQSLSFISNEGLLITGLKRIFPKYFLEDFKFTKNEEQRSFNMSFVIRGFCETDKKGNMIIKFMSKDADIKKISEEDNKFMSVETNILYNTLETHIFELPKNAKNVSVEKDSFGYPYIKFDMSHLYIKNYFWLFSGVLSLIIGSVFLFFIMKKK